MPVSRVIVSATALFQSGNATQWFPVDVYRSLGPEWALDLLSSVLVLLAAYLVSRFVVQLFGRRIARRFRRPSLTRTAIRGIRLVIFLFAFLTVLGIYDYGLTDIALSVTVFTAVVGVILAPIVGSVISGVFLLADQPYEIGDMIELADADQTGFVEDITLRYTKIFTLDNTFLVIPNGTMRERDVLNYSAEDPRTRLRLDVLVTYESDVADARERIQAAARQVDVVIEGGPDIRVGAARYPAAPTCYIDAFADHGVRLTLRYWAKEPYKLLATRSKVQTAVYESFADADADADVEFAYPHSHLVVDETSGRLGIGMDENSAGAGPMEHGIDPVESPESNGGEREDEDRA